MDSLTCLICCFAFLSSYNIHAEVQRLIMDETLYNQIMYDKMQKMYTIKGLLPNAKYEVRISYSAVIPTDFVLLVEPTETSRINRKMLNVEQLQWKATHQNYLIKVIGHRTGLYFGMDRLKDPVPFNIVVNQLYFGCSLATWKLLIGCLLTNILVLKLVLPRLIKLIDCMAIEQKID